jgi:exodeoxyribonuclease-1
MVHAQMGLIVAVAIHPDRSNTVIAYDLSFDPAVLTERPIISEETPYPRQALFTIKLNQCPALAPISVLRAQDVERLEMDPDQCLRHLRALQEIDVLKTPLAQTLFEEAVPRGSKDIDSSLYEGFLGDRDRKTLDQFRLLAPEAMGDARLSFEDARLPEMIFRFRARNYPETLNPEERSRWQKFCRDRLLGQDAGGGLTLKDFEDRLNEWSLRGDLTTLQRDTLDALRRLTSLYQA